METSEWFVPTERIALSLHRDPNAAGASAMRWSIAPSIDRPRHMYIAPMVADPEIGGLAMPSPLVLVSVGCCGALR